MIYILVCGICGTLNTVEAALWEDEDRRDGVHCGNCVEGNYRDFSLFAAPAALAPDLVRVRTPA